MARAGQVEGRVCRARDTEVEQLGFAMRVHKDVAGLEIPVDDAVLVGVLNGIRGLDQELEAP